MNGDRVPEGNVKEERFLSHYETIWLKNSR